MERSVTHSPVSPIGPCEMLFLSGRPLPSGYVYCELPSHLKPPPMSRVEPRLGGDYEPPAAPDVSFPQTAHYECPKDCDGRRIRKTGDGEYIHQSAEPKPSFGPLWVLWGAFALDVVFVVLLVEWMMK